MVFKIFGGIASAAEWLHRSVLVDKPGFVKVQCWFFPDLGLGLLAGFWPNRFDLRGFLK